MLCLCGFGLYSRWVPLEFCSQTAKLYNNHFELERLEPSNKDGCLGSFHEMLGNRASLNARKLQVCGEEVLE